MSRRDTIIIAVLVNAGLLMILFATAMRSDKAEEVVAQGGMQLAEAPVVEELNLEDALLDSYVASLAESEDSFFFDEEEDLAFTPPPQPTPVPKVVKAPKPAAPTTPAQFVNVTVKKGDFLEKIAKANQTTVAAIMHANTMSSTQLKVGQVLKIPLSRTSSQSPPPAPSEEDYYIVKDGDNPWLIAHRNHVSLQELLRLNGLDEQKARRLRPGDRIRIR